MPSGPPPVPRSLSLEETEQLAGLARRKSNDRVVREDLRLKLGHNNVLDSLLRDIAKRSPPPSPLQRSVKPDHKPRTIQWATQVVSKVEHVEHYEFTNDDNDEEEDLAGLSLCRVSSRPVR